MKPSEPERTAPASPDARECEFVVNSIREAISIIDADLVYRNVNDGWCRLTGLAREDVVGRDADEAVGHIVTDPHRQALRRCLATGERQTVRSRAALPGRGPTTLRSDYYPYRGGDDAAAGPARCAVVVTRDLSADEAAAAERARLLENLRHVLEATGEAIVAVDGDGELLFVNARFLELCPVSPATLVAGGDAVVEALLALSAEPLRDAERLGRALAGSEPSEDVVELPDGRTLLRRTLPLRVPGARRIGRVWSLRDISAEARARRALEASRREARRLAVVAEHAGNAVVIGGRDGTIEWTNPAFTRMTGWSAEEARGRRPAELLGDAAADPRTQTRLDAAVAAGEALRVDVRNRRKDGTSFWVDVDLQPVLGDDGAPSGFIAIQTDITARKARERETLEARQAAEEASRAKSRFLSSMSHELRTPLNAVLGFAQLLAMNGAEPLTPTQARHVDEIVRGGRHLLALIEQLLDLSRIEAGRLAVRLEPLDLQALLRETTDFIEPLAAERGIALVRHCSPERHPPVAGDATRVRQVLLNLLHNAVKYNRRGGRIEVSCERRELRLRVVVADTGRGLTAEQQRYLFRRFERLGAEQGSEPGAGVGLALSRELMALMHGDIGVDSRPGEGSRFWIELPLA